MYRAVILFLFALNANAHEMVPTYPKLEPSHVEGVFKAELEMFNKRKDVEYYELGVFTEDWEPIKFVSRYKIMHLRYLGHIKFDVYVRQADADKAHYVCSQSKLRGTDTGALLATRICSKFRH